MSSSKTTLPISYKKYYCILIGQADQAASAHVGRSIWYSSDKQLTYFKSDIGSTTHYATIGF